MLLTAERSEIYLDRRFLNPLATKVTLLPNDPQIYFFTPLAQYTPGLSIGSSAPTFLWVESSRLSIPSLRICRLALTKPMITPNVRPIPRSIKPMPKSLTGIRLCSSRRSVSKAEERLLTLCFLPPEGISKLESFEPLSGRKGRSQLSL